MGGDRAPDEEVKGALAAKEFLGKDDRIVLVGQEDAILARLNGQPGWQDFIEIVHAEQVITMGESPIEALRTKPESSLVKLTQLHKEGKVDACISAGNTGAFVASAQMNLRRLPGVHRPGIAIVTPTLKGPVALCDVGANVDCRPQHLYQYGVMASVYLSAVSSIQRPRIGLMSVGEEEAKGNEVVKRTHEMLKADEGINFIGNVEGRDVFRGTCDVIVCDGFVGNVAIKLIEGMAEGVIKGIIGEIITLLPMEIALQAKSSVKSVMGKYDYNEYGGAPLLGVNGVCIICHGSSSYRGIMNAVRVAGSFAKYRVNEKITQLLSNGDKVNLNG